MEWVAEVNRERVRFRANGYRPSFSITSQNGSQDPFYIKVDKHYGSSDHVTYMQHGIPSLMFITWPDMWYHSSQDIPQQLDPTQFRRAAVVGIGAMSVLASADDAVASTVAGESFTRGAERMGEAVRKGVAYMADARDAAGLAEGLKEARNAVAHQTRVEQDVIRSASVLFSSRQNGERRLSPLVERVSQRGKTLGEEVDAYFEVRSASMNVKAAKPSMTAEEREASKRVVTRPEGSGRGGMRGLMSRFSEDERKVLSAIPQHMTAELAILLSQGKTVLEIRDFLSGEFEPLPLKDLNAYIAIMQKAGIVKVGSN
jgi:hypothetical protein